MNDSAPTNPTTPTDPTRTDTGGRTLASKVRAGNWLLVDGYVRQVVRVETIAATQGPARYASEASVEKVADGPVLHLRVSFLNGGTLVLTSSDSVEICRTAGRDSQPADPPSGFAGFAREN